MAFLCSFLSPFQKIFSFVTTFLLILSAILILFFHQQHEKTIVPEIEAKVSLIGKLACNPIQKALDLGVEINNLRGVSEHLAHVERNVPEVTFLILENAEGKFIASHSMEKRSDLKEKHMHVEQLPLYAGHMYRGSLKIGVDTARYTPPFASTIFDFFYLILAIIVLFTEITFFTYFLVYRKTWDLINMQLSYFEKGCFLYYISEKSSNIIGYFIRQLEKVSMKISKIFFQLKGQSDIFHLVHAKEGPALRKNLEKIAQHNQFAIPLTPLKYNAPEMLRFPLFLWVFSTALFLPFLSVVPFLFFIKGSQVFTVLSAFPIIFFLLGCLISFLFFQKWRTEVNAKILYPLGTLIYCVGVFCTFFAHNILEFTALQFICGLGHGFFIGAFYGFITALISQDFPKEESKLITLFIAPFYGAYISGSILGGLILFYFGFHSLMVSSLVIIGVAFIITQRILPHSPVLPTLSVSFLSGFKAFFAHKKLMLITTMIIVPQRMVTGAILMALPFFLFQNHVSLPDIGQVMGTYGVALYLGILGLESLLEKIPCHYGYFLLAGSIGCGFLGSLFFLISYPPLTQSLFFVILLGLGHFLSMAGQSCLKSSSHFLPREAAGLMPISYFFSLLGFVIGAFIFAIFLYYVSISTGFFIFASFSALFFICFLVLTLRKIENTHAS